MNNMIEILKIMRDKKKLVEFKTKKIIRVNKDVFSYDTDISSYQNTRKKFFSKRQVIILM